MGKRAKPSSSVGFFRRDCPHSREEGGDDAKSAWPLHPGLHTCYNGTDKGFAKPQGGANPIKRCPSSDWRLQLASMKPESLVTVDQLCHGEYVLDPCTHRPSSQPSWQCPNFVFLFGTRQGQQGGLSRNKVSVGESADGSPPF